MLWLRPQLPQPFTAATIQASCSVGRGALALELAVTPGVVGYGASYDSPAWIDCSSNGTAPYDAAVAPSTSYKADAMLHLPGDEIIIELWINGVVGQAITLLIAGGFSSLRDVFVSPSDYSSIINILGALPATSAWWSLVNSSGLSLPVTGPATGTQCYEWDVNVSVPVYAPYYSSAAFRLGFLSGLQQPTAAACLAAPYTVAVGVGGRGMGSPFGSPCGPADTCAARIYVGRSNAALTVNGTTAACPVDVPVAAAAAGPIFLGMVLWQLILAGLALLLLLLCCCCTGAYCCCCRRKQQRKPLPPPAYHVQAALQMSEADAQAAYEAQQRWFAEQETWRATQQEAVASQMREAAAVREHHMQRQQSEMRLLQESLMAAAQFVHTPPQHCGCPESHCACPCHARLDAATASAAAATARVGELERELAAATERAIASMAERLDEQRREAAVAASQRRLLEGGVDAASVALREARAEMEAAQERVMTLQLENAKLIQAAQVRAAEVSAAAAEVAAQHDAAIAAVRASATEAAEAAATAARTAAAELTNQLLAAVGAKQQIETELLAAKEAAAAELAAAASVRASIEAEMAALRIEIDALKAQVAEAVSRAAAAATQSETVVFKDNHDAHHGSSTADIRYTDEVRDHCAVQCVTSTAATSQCGHVARVTLQCEIGRAVQRHRLDIRFVCHSAHAPAGLLTDPHRSWWPRGDGARRLAKGNGNGYFARDMVSVDTSSRKSVMFYASLTSSPAQFTFTLPSSPASTQCVVAAGSARRTTMPAFRLCSAYQTSESATQSASTFSRKHHMPRGRKMATTLCFPTHCMQTAQRLDPDRLLVP